MRAVAGEAFKLDGSGSRLAIAFAWAQTGGGLGNLTLATNAIAEFTAAATGNFQFQLTVQGPGGPSTANTSVVVAPAPPPDTLTVDLCEYRTSRRQFRVSGVVDNLPNEIIASIGGFELGRATPDITGAWSVRRTLADAEQAQVPDVGTQIGVKSKTGGQTATVQIRN